MAKLYAIDNRPPGCARRNQIGEDCRRLLHHVHLANQQKPEAWITPQLLRAANLVQVLAPVCQSPQPASKTQIRETAAANSPLQSGLSLIHGRQIPVNRRLMAKLYAIDNRPPGCARRNQIGEDCRSLLRPVHLANQQKPDAWITPQLLRAANLRTSSCACTPVDATRQQQDPIQETRRRELTPSVHGGGTRCPSHPQPSKLILNMFN
jgi:hypothetical protein